MRGPLRLPRPSVVLGTTVLTAAMLTAAAEPKPTTPATPRLAPVAAASTTVLDLAPGRSGTVLRDGDSVSDRSGRGNHGRVRVTGTTLPVRDAAGQAALRYPDPCATSGCAKAVVQVADDAVLRPGRRDFRYGARILLAPGRTSDGSNVVQKGFAGGGKGQWKLQVDGRAGRPSCVLVGTGSRTRYKATAAVSVADGRWHDVTCVRAGTRLTVEVDGRASGSRALPRGLDVAPTAPVRVGGKNLKANNDQYFGLVARVHLQLGS